MATTEAAVRTGLCLSVRQPWAWLIVHGYKPIENRDWSTNVRGVIGIHAAKKFDREGYDFVRETFPGVPMPDQDAFELGGIVGRARIVGCVHEGDAHLLTERDEPWFFGAYGFVFDSAEPLPFRPCRGRLGFFRPELEVAP